MLQLDDPIVIIGAGASGLVSAKALQSEGFTHLTILERREDVGGVWLFDDPDNDAGDGQEGRVVERFPSPMYDTLVGNIWYKLLELEHHAFPPDTPPFPTRRMMHTYLTTYAADLRPCIRTCTNVESVAKDGDMWVVESRSTITTTTTRPTQITRDKFSAVVLACGIYDTPDEPNIPGLAEMKTRYPGMVTHSKDYRTPHGFRDKRVLVVGNGPSAIDIAAQVAEVARVPVMRAMHGPPEHACLPDERIHDCVPVARFDAATRTAHLRDGRILADLDGVVLATGYRYRYPWLKTRDAWPVITDGARVQHLYRHLFYVPDPTLVFVGLLIAAIPFPISEAQALVAARVFSGRLSLPATQAMREDEAARLAVVGDTYKFHKMRYPLDAEYGDAMRAWCLEARPVREREKLPVAWTQERRAWRRANYEMKMGSLREARDQCAT